MIEDLRGFPRRGPARRSDEFNWGDRPGVTELPLPALNAAQQEESSRPVGRYGLFTDKGEAIFESPTPAQVENLRGLPRIEYFKYRIPGRINDRVNWNTDPPIIPTESYVTPSMIEGGFQGFTEEELQKAKAQLKKGDSLGGYLYSISITNFLEEKISKDFLGQGSREIGIRGVAASVDGAVDSPEGRVIDIRDIVMLGDERGRDKTLITGFDINASSPHLHYRTLQWLVQGTQKLRTSLLDNLADAQRIFPAILVYDTSLLRPGNATYEAYLPDSMEERATVIQKAYILDYPSS